MTNPKCKLVVVPEGCVVVPEEPDDVMIDATFTAGSGPITRDQKYGYAKSALRRAIKAAPPLPDTPPALRWEGNRLKFYNTTLIRTIHTLDGWSYEVSAMTCGSLHDTEQEARRAAEKALGFPDDLVV